MLSRKSRVISAFLSWLKVTLLVFLILMMSGLILLPVFTFLRVPSFVLGNDTIWLLRWQYSPEASFAITFNPGILLAIASVIGVLRMIYNSRHKRRQQK
jgi:signal transduction histidine kinase